MGSADPVTAVAQALGEALGIVRPVVEEAVRQKFEDGHRERMEEWSGICAIADDGVRADRTHTYVLRLLSEAGKAQGRVDGRTIRVPVDILDALIEEVSEGIKKDGILNRIQFK